MANQDKWKMLQPDPGINYGISQTDMYQMYAYAKKYKASQIWLLYPSYHDVMDLKNLRFKANEDDQDISVHVFFIDLSDYRNSIRELYDDIYTEEYVIPPRIR